MSFFNLDPIFPLPPLTGIASDSSFFSTPPSGIFQGVGSFSNIISECPQEPNPGKRIYAICQENNDLIQKVNVVFWERFDLCQQRISLKQQSGELWKEVGNHTDQLEYLRGFIVEFSQLGEGIEEKLEDLFQLKREIEEKRIALLEKVVTNTQQMNDLFELDKGKSRDKYQYYGRMNELFSECQKLLLNMKASPELPQAKELFSDKAFILKKPAKNTSLSEFEKTMYELCQKNVDLTQRINRIFWENFELRQQRVELLQEGDKLSNSLDENFRKIKSHFERWNGGVDFSAIEAVQKESDEISQRFSALTQQLGVIRKQEEEKLQLCSDLLNNIMDLSTELSELFASSEGELLADSDFSV